MKFEFYRETHKSLKSDPAVSVPLAEGDYRWRLIASNGRNVANGGEGYTNFRDMLKTLRSIFCMSTERSRELDAALHCWCVEHGPLEKPFEFSEP